MGNVQDRWWKPNPEDGMPARVHSKRYGVGLRWTAEWLSPDGSRHRKSFATKARAQAYLDEQESDKRRGTYVAPNRVTVGELWPRWEVVKSGLARTTREGYAAAWSVYVRPRWATTPVVEVDKASVMEWLPTLRTKAGKPLSASWARKVAITLGGILDMAVDGRLIPSNPLSRMGKALPAQLPSERRYLTVAEIDLLTECAEKEGITLPVRVLVMTGLRRGEMAGLQVRDLDRERGRLRISRDIDSYGDVDATKTRRHRDVPVGGDLLAELVAAAKGKDRSAVLLPSPSGEPWRRDNWRGRWDRATAAAGLVGIDTHELRHTAVSLAIHAGANIKTVQRMVGHSSAAITLDVYGHLFEDDLDSLPARLTAFMESERERAGVYGLSHSPPVPPERL